MLNLKHQADQCLSYVTSVFSCLRVMIRAGAMQSFCPLPHVFAPAGCGSSRPSEEGEPHPRDIHGKGIGVSGRGAAPPQDCCSAVSSSRSILESCHANCSLVDIHDPFLLPPCVNSLQLGYQEVKTLSPQSPHLFRQDKRGG